jgi:hypothetical protein
MLTIPLDCCFAAGAEFRICPLCGRELEAGRKEKQERDNGWNQTTTLGVCPKCHWWTLGRTGHVWMPEKTVYTSTNTFSILSECNIGDKELALGHLRSHLVSRFDDIYHIHPRKLEEIICAVFREHGFRAAVRSYCKDGGIDVIVFKTENNQPTAVQVKRYKQARKIGVEEIHQFLGTLLVNDIAHGIFVTTSNYTRGAKRIALKLQKASPSISLTLIDAQQLLELLSETAPGVNDPLEIAWRLREHLPSEMDMYGDWLRTGADWPRVPPSAFHVEWWIEQYRRMLRFQNDSSVGPELPAVLTREEVDSSIESIARGRYIEITYIGHDGVTLRSTRSRPPERYENGVLWSGGYGVEVHRNDIVDIREWRPRPGCVVFEYGHEIGEVPSDSWSLEPTIWD